MGGRGPLATESGLYTLSRKGYQFLESFEALDGHKYPLRDTGRAFWGSITIRLPYYCAVP